jgi:hypothetical protein
MANNWKYWDSNGNPQTWGVGASLPAGADLFRAEFLNQFVDAINERHDLAVVVFGYSPITAAGAVPTTHIMGDISAGDDIAYANDDESQPYKTILGMQRATNELLAMGHTWKRWMYDDGSEPRITTGYDQFDLDASRINSICGFSDITPKIGFRRSADNVSFSAGELQRGDIVGPWIFEDLRAVLGLMHWFGNALMGSLSYSAQGGSVNVEACSRRKLSSEDPEPWTCNFTTGLAGYNHYTTSSSSGGGESYSKSTGRTKSFVGYPFAGEYLFRAWVKLQTVGIATYYDFGGLGAEGAWITLIEKAHSASAAENKEDWMVDALSEPSLPEDGSYGQYMGSLTSGAYCLGVVSKASFQYE